LIGEAISQQQLSERINEVFGTKHSYHELTVAEFLDERQKA